MEIETNSSRNQMRSSPLVHKASLFIFELGDLFPGKGGQTIDRSSSLGGQYYRPRAAWSTVGEYFRPAIIWRLSHSFAPRISYGSKGGDNSGSNPLLPASDRAAYRNQVSNSYFGITTEIKSVMAAAAALILSCGPKVAGQSSSASRIIRTGPCDSVFAIARRTARSNSSPRRSFDFDSRTGREVWPRSQSKCHDKSGGPGEVWRPPLRVLQSRIQIAPSYKIPPTEFGFSGRS